MKNIIASTALAVLSGGCCCLRQGATTEMVVERSGAAIQRAIDKVAEAGGGRVVVPAGVYPSGSIRLRSNVDLHLEKDAVIRGGTKSEDYFSFPDEICALKPENSDKVFLYAWDAANFAITGEGTIDGQGLAFFDVGAWKYGERFFRKPPCARPRMLTLVRCHDFRLEGVTFKDSPCWTMQIRLCDNIAIDGISVVADQRIINSDGIDLDCCRHVRMVNSYLRTGDDCLAIRAIREEGGDGRALTEDIVVSDCELYSACQAIRMGCPSDDEIRDVKFSNIRSGGWNGINFDYPSVYVHPADEGYMNIHDIEFDGFTGVFLGYPIRIWTGPGVKLRSVRDIVFRNVDVHGAQDPVFVGNIHTKIERVSYDNVVVNRVRQLDGEVAADCTEAGPLKRRAGKSWESTKSSVGKKK